MKKFFKILGLLILLAIIIFFAYRNRWRLQTSVPVDQYPEYIVGEWENGGSIWKLYPDGNSESSEGSGLIVSENWTLDNIKFTLQTYWIQNHSYIDSNTGEEISATYDSNTTEANIVFLNENYLIFGEGYGYLKNYHFTRKNKP